MSKVYRLSGACRARQTRDENAFGRVCLLSLVSSVSLPQGMNKKFMLASSPPASRARAAPPRPPAPATAGRRLEFIISEIYDGIATGERQGSNETYINGQPG